MQGPQLSGNISDSGIRGWNALGIDGNSEAPELLIIQDGVFVPVISFTGQKNEGAVGWLQDGFRVLPYRAGCTMFLRGLALRIAVTRRPIRMAPALVAGIAKQALRAKLIDSKASTLSQRNDEHSGITAFVLAVLVEADVVQLILIRLQRKIVNLFPSQVAELVLERQDFRRGLRKPYYQRYRLSVLISNTPARAGTPT